MNNTTQASPEVLRAALVSQFWGAPEQARFDQTVIAPVVGYSESALEKFRSVGGGPKFVRLGGVCAKDKNGRRRLFGGKVQYVKLDVVKWMEQQKSVSNTSEAQLVYQAA